MLCISWYQICQIEFLPEIQKSTFAMSMSSSHPFSGSSITLAYEPPKECWVLNDPSLNRNTSKWKTLKFPNLEALQGPTQGASRWCMWGLPHVKEYFERASV